MFSIQLMGSERHHGLAKDLLARAGLTCRTRTPSECLRLGSALPGGTATLALWPPGTHPLLEAALFSDATPVLHTWWGGSRAEVGPLTVRGAGPCPVCCASPRRPDRGEDTALAVWALSWAALQAKAYLAQDASELVGAAWVWDTGEPGLGSTAWRRRAGCATAGCAGC